MFFQNYNLIKNKKATLLFSIFFFVFSFAISAEENFSSDTSNTQIQIQQPQAPSTAETDRLKKFKAAARARLIKKLTSKNGKATPIVILPPVDYTSLQQPEVITETVRKAIQVYDEKINIKLANFAMSSLTLEQFRKAVIALKSDVIVTTIMYPTNFDIYLYDARTPFQIYAHSEPISGAAQYELTKEAAQYYTKILVRRTLYRFIKNQYYELPREQTATVLKSEIPRYIASPESLELVNRDARSNFYASVGLGAALSSGTNSNLWNSNLFSFQLGTRITDGLFGELSLDMFAYNVGSAFAKYFFFDKNKSMRLSAGLGLGYAINRYTLNWDQNNSIRNGTVLVAPDITLLLPISEVYLKVESRAYIGVNNKALVLTLFPGLFLLF